MVHNLNGSFQIQWFINHINYTFLKPTLYNPIIQTIKCLWKLKKMVMLCAGREREILMWQSISMSLSAPWHFFCSHVGVDVLAILSYFHATKWSSFRTKDRIAEAWIWNKWPKRKQKRENRKHKTENPGNVYTLNIYLIHIHIYLIRGIL